MLYQHVHLKLTEYYASVLSQQSWGVGTTFSTRKKKKKGMNKMGKDIIMLMWIKKAYGS